VSQPPPSIGREGIKLSIGGWIPSLYETLERVKDNAIGREGWEKEGRGKR
jgi:hypothetical protein